MQTCIRGNDFPTDFLKCSGGDGI